MGPACNRQRRRMGKWTRTARPAVLMVEHQFVIGQSAAVWQSGYGDGAIHKVTIERDTKLYWVADGRKFRKSDGVEPGSNSGWSRARYLLPLSDPKVIRASIAARKSAAYGAVIRASEELRADRENPERIQAVRSALDAYEKALQ